MTAKDLLYQLLDYRCIWSLPQYSNTDSAKIRLSRITALQDAFGLSKKYADPTRDIRYNGVDRATHLREVTELNFLLRGGFLSDRPLEDNGFLMANIKARVDHVYKGRIPCEIRKPHITWLFNDLLDYRHQLFQITHPWRGMMEGFSASLHYSKSLQKDLNSAIDLQVDEIDQALWLLLDPGQRDIPIDRLVSEFNYNPANLSDLDSKALSE